jgi:uncharacterized protein
MSPTENRESSLAPERLVLERNVPVPMDDGTVLSADVFRPPHQTGRFPAILSYGPFGKDLAFQVGYARQWEVLAREHPEALAHSSNRYQNWLVVDPEKWVPDGYGIVRVDARGSGRSAGMMDPFSPREARDLYECIEWAAEQPWCSGKVGLCGVSYYAMIQWLVAGLQPPHLAAMIPWDGGSELYRDAAFHGGIPSDLGEFATLWYRSLRTYRYDSGPAASGDSSSAADECRLVPRSSHELDDEWHRERAADWSKIEVPFLSAANWGSGGIDSRGNFEAFQHAASAERWLAVHGLEVWTQFYTPYGLDLQKRFFGHFLRGEDTGWTEQPRVQLQVRHVDGRFHTRHENEWPLARTRWERLWLHGIDRSLRVERPSHEQVIEYDPLELGLLFCTPPLEARTEITGPLSAHLYVSSSSTDADLFLVVRVYDPDGDEVTFQGSVAPNAPVTQGWLRASQRRLDPARSLPYRPFHTHDRIEPLEPGAIYELDVEIWPTSVVVPAGYQLALGIRGTDHEYLGSRKNPVTARSSPASRTWRACGPSTHSGRASRRSARTLDLGSREGVDLLAGIVRVHTGPDYPSSLLLPVIPSRRGAS